MAAETLGWRGFCEYAVFLIVPIRGITTGNVGAKYFSPLLPRLEGIETTDFSPPLPVGFPRVSSALPMPGFVVSPSTLVMRALHE